MEYWAGRGTEVVAARAPVADDVHEDAARDQAALLRAVCLVRASEDAASSAPSGKEADEEVVLCLGATLLGDDAEHEEAESRVAHVSTPAAREADFFEKSFCLLVIELTRPVLGGFAVAVAHVEVCAAVQEEADHFAVQVAVTISGEYERCLSIFVTCVDLSAMVEEQFYFGVIPDESSAV